MNGNPIALALEEYDRTRAIIDGTVKIPGIESKIIPLPSAERHRRMLSKEEFDVCELSMSSFLMVKTRGARITGLPIFPRRLFPQSFIYINRASGIRAPRDLIGKKVGVPMYQVTMVMLVKGFLQHEYDVRPQDITWVAAREELIPFNKPPNIRIERAPNDSAIYGLLADGKIDCVIHPDVIPPFEEHPERVARLFPDFREQEIAYYRKTGIYPIMHIIVVKDRILQQYPTIPASLSEAFDQAKRLCYEFLGHPPNSSLVWSRQHLEEQTAILGADPFPYGLEKNRDAVKQLIQYSREQGLIDYEPTVEELFHKTDGKSGN